MLSLDELKIRFLVRFPGFKDIFNRVDIKIDDSLATACTDGYTLFFSSEYMSGLNEEQQLFVFAHELLHVALEHIARSEGKNHKNWNIATDAVINAYIKKCGIQSPDNLVEIADALNYSAETLYEKLQKEDEEKEKKKTDETPEDSDKKGSGTEEIETSSGGNNNEGDNKEGDKKEGGNSSGDDNKEEPENPGFDDHSRWKDGLERMKKEQEQNSTEGKDNNSKDIDERDAFGRNDRVKDKLDGDTLGPNISGSDTSGSGAGGGNRRGNDGDNVRVDMIPWQRLLKESVSVDYDYVTTEGEEEDGVIVIPFEPYPKPKTEIIIDSSVSISDDLIKNFLSECMSIIGNSETDIGFFGTSFSGFQRVRTEQDINDLEIYDGGGTDFNVAVNSFTNRAENKIIFTDGLASNPNKYCDAIWVVVGDSKHEIHPPGGRVIYITGEAYHKLCESRKSKTR